MDYEKLCALMTSRIQDVKYDVITKQIVKIMYNKGREAIERFKSGIFSGCGKRRIEFDVDFLLEKFEKIYQEFEVYRRPKSCWVNKYFCLSIFGIDLSSI